MACVGAEIHHHLVHLRPVGHDDATARHDFLPDLNAGRHGGAHKLNHFLDNMLHPDRQLFSRGFPAEGQDLLHKLLGAHRGLGDRAQIVLQIGIGRHLARQHVRVSQNGSEQVIKIVRNTCRHHADGFHLLCDSQLCLQRGFLFLELLAQRNVLFQRDVVGNVPPLVRDRAYMRILPVQLPILLPVGELAMPKFPGRDGFPHVAIYFSRSRPRLQQPRILSPDLLRGVAAHL